MKELLKGKSAIVTGGTSGIGKAIALKFAEQGAQVAIFGQNHERGSKVVEEMRNLTETALFLPVDVSNQAEVDKACDEVLQVFGGVDILVNNAGITRDGLLLRMKEKDWDDVMAINVKSCYNLCHALARSMVRARKGSIINMGSIVGLTGNAGQINYAASKAAVVGLTKAMAKELACRSIRVNCIAPGYIDTAMTEALTPAQKEAILAKIPLERMGSSDDIANMALFLGSDLSSYITGQVLTIDGGMSL